MKPVKKIKSKPHTNIRNKKQKKNSTGRARCMIKI